MNKNRFLLVLTSLVLTATARAEPVEQRVMDVPIGKDTFCWAREDGCLYNYRSGAAQLISVVSLNEGDRYQSLVGNQYGKRWDLDVTEAIPGKHALIKASGAVMNPASLTGIVETVSKNRVRTTLRYERTLSVGRWRPRLLVYLPAWMKSEGAPFRVTRPDGSDAQTLPTGQPLLIGMKPTQSEAVGPYCRVGAFPASSVVHVGLKGRAETFSLSLDKAVEISAFDFGYDLVGLWFEIPNEAETTFTLTIEHADLHTQIGSGDFTTSLNSENGLARVISGGVPLLDSVEVEESTVHQSRTAGWTVVSTRDAATLRGKLVSAWEVTCATRRREGAAEAQMHWRRATPSGQSVRLRVAFPYHLLGRSVILARPRQTATTMINGIPLRLGGNVAIGDVPSGSNLWFHVSGGENARLTIPDACKVELTRENPREASLILTFPTGRSDRFSLAALRINAPLPSVIVAHPLRWSHLSKDRAVDVMRDDRSGDLSIITPYWKVTHSRQQGGAIDLIAHRYGNCRNLLLGPQRSFAVIEGREFSDVYDSKATLESEPGKTPILALVTARGHLKTKNGLDSGIAFTHVYEYHAGFCRRTSTFNFGAQPVRLSRFCVARMDWAQNLNEYGARCYDDTKPWVPTTWGKAVFPGPPVWEETTCWSYLALFDRGVEAVDSLPATDTMQWKHTFTNEDNRASYAICENEHGTASFVLEPYADPSHPVDVSGEKRFEFYLGLSRIREKLPPPYFQIAVFSHLADEQVIKEAAYAGMNLVLGPGETPGDYFRTKNREENVRFADWAHRYGMKCMPFLPFALINRQVEAYKQHARDWEILVGGNGKLAPPHGYGDYGDEMCAAAPGFREHVKQGEAEILTRYPFDGIYHDFTHPLSCLNPRHYPHEHTNIDGVVELIEWLRNQLRPGQIFEGHTGWVPTLMLQDLTDLKIIYEETSLEGVHTVVDMPGSGQFGNDVPSTLCCAWLSYNAIAPGENPDTSSPPPKPRDVQAFISRCALLGLFPLLNAGGIGAHNPQDVLKSGQPFFDYVAAFRSFDLSKFRFADYLHQTAVTSTNAFVRSAIFWNEDQAIVIASNSESAETQDYALHINVAAFGWGNDPVAVTRTPNASAIETVLPSQLQSGCMRGTLNGYGYHVWSLRRLPQGRPAVVFGTRAWSETFAAGKLHVTTAGPKDQPARFLIHCENRPAGVTINGEPVRSLPWDPKNRLAEVKFSYPDTGSVVIDLH